jgi:hypothetical protein
MAQQYEFKFPAAERDAKRKKLEESKKPMKEFAMDMDGVPMDAQQDLSELVYNKLARLAFKKGLNTTQAQLLASDIMDLFYVFVDQGKYSMMQKTKLDKAAMFIKKAFRMV